jgi:hypothetical protein
VNDALVSLRVYEGSYMLSLQLSREEKKIKGEKEKRKKKEKKK